MEEKKGWGLTVLLDPGSVSTYGHSVELWSCRKSLLDSPRHEIQSWLCPVWPVSQPLKQGQDDLVAPLNGINKRVDVKNLAQCLSLNMPAPTFPRRVGPILLVASSKYPKHLWQPQWTIKF